MANGGDAMEAMEVLFEISLAGGSSTSLTSRLSINHGALGGDFRYRAAGQDRSCKR